MTSLLTNIKLKALLYVGVAAASCLVVLFQHQDFLPGFGQRGSSCQPTDTTPDDDDIQILRHLVKTETWTEETHRPGFQYGKTLSLLLLA